MPNLQLTNEQHVVARSILEDVRARLRLASGDDERLLFAFRRKIHKELMYDERSKPAERNRIKKLHRVIQGGACAICGVELPEKYAVLDRFEAWRGYTVENTRLIHAECDQLAQAKKAYT